MSARFIVSNEIDVTIYDDLKEGKIWVEVEVKVAGPDMRKHVFDAGIANNVVKVKDKQGYIKLRKYIPSRVASEYDVLV